MASLADGDEGPVEVATPVVADTGPSGDPSVWTGSHPTIKATVEDAAHYRNLLPKYKDYFKDRELLTHPEELTIIKRVVTMVVHDVNLGKLTSVDKDILASALSTCGIKPMMIAKSDYANYDLLLESEEKARDAASKVHRSKNFKMEPMYMGRRHTSLTIYNVPVDISRDCLGAFFSQYGDVESVTAGRLKCGVMSANYRIAMKTTTTAYEEVPDYLICRGRQITVVVEGRKGHCFSCRKQGHLARDCPLRKKQQQQQQQQKSYASATSPTSPTAPAASTAPAPAPVKTPAPAPASAPTPPAPVPAAQDEEGGWTVKTYKRNKSPRKSTPPASPAKAKVRAEVVMEVDPKSQKRRAASSDEEAAPKPATDPKKKKAVPRSRSPAKPVQKKAQKSHSSPVPEPSPKPSKAPAAMYVSSATPKPLVQDLPTPDVSIPTPSSSISGPIEATPPPTAEAPSTEAPLTTSTKAPPTLASLSTTSLPIPSTPFILPASPTTTTSPQSTPTGTQTPSTPSSPSRGRSESIARTHSNSALTRSRSTGRRKPFKDGIECLQVREDAFENLSVPMKTILNSLKKRKTFKKLNCEDPRNFPNARLVMSLIRTTGRVRAWDLIDYAKKAFPDIAMVDMGSADDKILKNVRNKVSGRLPIYLHPSLYRSLKLIYPSDVGVIVRDGRVPHEHGHGNLGLHAGQLCLEDFEPVCDKE